MQSFAARSTKDSDALRHRRESAATLAKSRAAHPLHLLDRRSVLTFTVTGRLLVFAIGELPQHVPCVRIVAQGRKPDVIGRRPWPCVLSSAGEPTRMVTSAWRSCSWEEIIKLPFVATTVAESRSVTA